MKDDKYGCGEKGCMDDTGETITLSGNCEKEFWLNTGFDERTFYKVKSRGEDSNTGRMIRRFDNTLSFVANRHFRGDLAVRNRFY